MSVANFEDGRIARIKERGLEQQGSDIADVIEDIVTLGWASSSRSHYNPPSDPQSRAHYDEGYEYEREQNG